MGDASNRKVGVDTKTKANAKNNPSKLKFRLQKTLSWGPEWEQIYRGLKTFAALSDGGEYVKDSGRVQVIGESYIYAEKATPDRKQTKRVVWKEPE